MRQELAEEHEKRPLGQVKQVPPGASELEINLVQLGGAPQTAVPTLCTGRAQGQVMGVELVAKGI